MLSFVGRGSRTKRQHRMYSGAYETSLLYYELKIEEVKPIIATHSFYN